MKLSAILAPMIAAGVPGDVILATVKAFEDERADLLEKRRESDRIRQTAKRSRESRDTSTVSRDRPLMTRADDAPDLENKQTNKPENKEDTSPSARSKRGTRIPDNFAPDEEWAVSEGLHPSGAHVEARQFIDYWRAKAGKDGLKLDWPATWRMWVRNAIKRRSHAPPPRGRVGVVDAAQKIMESRANGSASIFGDNGDAQRLPSGRGSELGGSVTDIRGGIRKQFVPSGN